MTSLSATTTATTAATTTSLTANTSSSISTPAQSSLLLSTANLSWTPSSSGTGVLAAPQPPIERPVVVASSSSQMSSPTQSDHSSFHHMTHEEIIASLRQEVVTTTTTTIDSTGSPILDASFQTISLADTNTGVVGGRGGQQSLLSGVDDDDDGGGGDSDDDGQQSTTSSLSSAYAYNQRQTQKLSFIESLFQRTQSLAAPVLTAATGRSAATTNTTTGADVNRGGGSGISTPGSPPQLYSSPDSQPLAPPPTTASPTDTNISSSPVPTVPSLPLPPPPPPIAPPVDSMPSTMDTPKRDFKLKGPLRLYDPKHGSSSFSRPPPPTTTTGVVSLSQQQQQHESTVPLMAPIDPLSSSSSSMIPPFVPPLPTSGVGGVSLYNPLDYYNTDSCGAPETLDPTTTTTSAYTSAPIVGDCGSSNTTDYISFVSQTQQQQQHQQQSVASATAQMYDQQYGDWSQQQQQQPPSSLATAASAAPVVTYEPIVHHWFYQLPIVGGGGEHHHQHNQQQQQQVWQPFSLYDSYNLEQALIGSPNYGYGMVIATDGGRYDVNVYDRCRRPVYWQDSDTVCRRCSWFYKLEGHNRWAPYDEDVSVKLEATYRQAVLANQWNARVELESGQEVVVMHGQQCIYHYQVDSAMPDGWGQAIENPHRPRQVHRGPLDGGLGFDIDEGEPEQIDHLVFLIHGIGEICDFRFRSIVEVVDDFRAISIQQMRQHYRSYMERGQLGRIEMLPISWHQSLHGQETGIDDRLKLITLDSIPKLRHFSNDTILDALFYTSPVYCQTIVSSVGHELNRLFQLFCQRNPNFYGTVALGGHSLGSLIVFDILAHQHLDQHHHHHHQQQQQPSQTPTTTTTSDTTGAPVDINSTTTTNDIVVADRDVSSPIVSYQFEPLGLGFPAINYPQLPFRPSAFFAMGSPLPMFLTVRGVQYLAPDYRLPTCPAVYNIFHPYDPIAYRLEPMIYPSFKQIKPVLIPHHKGRKRMHLELRDSLARVGTDIKNKIFHSIKYTLNSIHEFASRSANRPSAVVSQSSSSTTTTNTTGAGVGGSGSHDYGDNNDGVDADSVYNPLVNNNTTAAAAAEVLDGMPDDDDDQQHGVGLSPGALNSGRRIDYVLQESPVEAFNEYLFAMAAHACYWQSEDTALLMLRELYGQLGYYSDTTTTASTTGAAADAMRPTIPVQSVSTPLATSASITSDSLSSPPPPPPTGQTSSSVQLFTDNTETSVQFISH
ncbi:phospholipase DDHD2-like isoform X2 [Oppia nitens]|uniref:phospholipase DDHD2-like isoform X2 n=1 Tax=Oppia nitens TaxID=1686743 RepID=UPI0023D97926|nr:phospholipase DDHD2-like isoform X2 [Oppia nitens]